MRAATYARFSTDKQSDNSIEDQERNCIRYAERMQMEVSSRFEDKAISGTSKERPGYQAMLAAAGRGEFDVLLVDDLSRLSRDEIEIKQTIRRFKFRRIRIVGVSDGYDSATKGEKIQSTMRGLMNELYLDDLKEKTHRGLYGKASNGYSAGGRTYGYKRNPIENPAKFDANGRPEVVAVRRAVDDEEAKWVRHIFEWFAAGQSPKRIAARLNELGVPSPRGSTWATSAIYGDMSQGNGLLNNQLYIGRYVWNRSEWVKDPDTGKRRRIERKESDWVVTDMPELRVVPQPLWDAVKARQDEIRSKSVALRIALNNPKARSHSGKYLFSGLLKCGCCGANYTIWGSTSYACAINIQRGHAACTNRLRVPRHVVEERLLAAIEQDLFTEEAVEIFVREAETLLLQKSAEARPDHDALQKQLDSAERTIGNIMSAIKAGIITPSTKAELEKAEADRQRVKVALERAEVAPSHDALSTFMPHAAEKYRELISNLRSALYWDVPAARQTLKALIGLVKLRPHPRGYLEALLQPSADGLMALANGKQLNVGLVAGAGFEPAAFRL